MLIIIDAKSPEQSKNKLRKFGELIEFSSANITYNAVSGHPDVFFCKTNNKLIIAPNTPERFIQLLSSKGVDFIPGEKGIGRKYPESAIYNAVVTDDLLIHNIQITDKVILENTKEIKTVSVKQGYTKCNLLALGNNTFITSDIGIFLTLKKTDLNVLYVIPENIILQGFTSGFFGGSSGIIEKEVFINGNLDFYPDGRKVRKFLKGLKYKIVELYNGPLFDGGSMLFI
jgi:hypothetical protein